MTIHWPLSDFLHLPGNEQKDVFNVFIKNVLCNEFKNQQKGIRVFAKVPIGLHIQTLPKAFTTLM